MHIYSVLNPVNDESFTSWINRCEIKLSHRCISVESIQALTRSKLKCYPSLDPDFSKEILTSTTVHNVINTSPEKVWNHFRSHSEWIIPYSVTQFACKACLIDSLADQQCLVYKKRWRYLANPICDIHKCLLNELPYGDRYHIHVLSSGFTQTHKCRLDEPNLQIVVLLALKFQNFINNLEISTTFTDHKTQKALKLLIELFLCAGEPRGLACRTLSRSSPQRGAFKYFGGRALMMIGPVSCSAFERMCALILTGCIIGFYSERDLQTLAFISNEFGLLYGWSAYDIGKHSNVFVDLERSGILRRLIDLIPFIPASQYLNFIDGFKNG